MNVVLQVLYTVLGLGFLIFIHELGHFVAAKIFKVQTNEFSLGMGPKLISVKKIKATGKKKVTSFFSKEKPELDPDGNTAYSIRLLPIGGFVSMEGENEDSECDNALNRKPKWQRLIIMLAGITMNIIVAILITFVLTLTTSTPTTTIAVFENDSVSYETGLRENDKIVKIGNTKISTYTDISRAFQDNIGKSGWFQSTEEVMVTLELIRRKVKAHHQVKVYNYVVDFVLPEMKVILEIDGKLYHGKEKKQYETIRDELICEKFGEEWELIRIDTENINTNVTRLLLAINAVLRRRKRNKEGNGHDGNRISGTD